MYSVNFRKLRTHCVRALCATLVLLLAFEPAAWAATTVTYLHNDIAGSPMAATNESGNVLWRENYQPYGERIKKESAASKNTQFFHGKPVDTDTGLSYFGARYYDPVVGRFMAIDPVGFDENNLHSFNRYAYGNNNPYKYRDPDGNMSLPLVVVTVAVTMLVMIALTPRPGSGGGDLGGARGAPMSGTTTMPNPMAGIKGLFKSDDGTGGGEPRAGESGGPGGGKDFSDKDKDKIRDRDGNKCVFCKKDTARSPGPDQSNIDHADPKADGGNNSLNNGQNTCRTCNLDKGRRKTEEFLESGGRRVPPGGPS